MPLDTIVDRFRTSLRFVNGEMTQAELADAAGVTRQTVVAVEAGDYAPSVYLALAIAMTTVGASAVLGKRLAAEIPVGIGSALRFGIATLLFAPLLLRSGGPPRLGRGDLGLLALQSFFGVFGFALFWLNGLRMTGAAASSVEKRRL